LTREGTVVSTQRLSPPEATRLELDWQPADPLALAATRQAASPGRLVKLVAASPRRLAVACWGGRVEIRDDAVAVTKVHCGFDVTALSWDGSRLLLGDADGRLIALSTNP
jgi:hypothetical protein